VSRSWRSITLWLIGDLDAAKIDVERALSDAREVGHAVTLLYALITTALTQIYLGNYLVARLQCEEAVALADAKGALFWQALGRAILGIALLLTENTSIPVTSTVHAISSFRSVGATVTVASLQSYLGMARAKLGQFDVARSCIDEAIALAQGTGETWFDAEINRTAGEIELLSPERDTVKGQACFERALEIARTQQARSWELRAATSLARLWRDQGKRAEAHELLAPIYGWFTEGFDTFDLKEAKTLLEELA
jgi:predicted ATPase